MKRITLTAAIFLSVAAAALILSNIFFDTGKAQSETDKSSEVSKKAKAEAPPQNKRLFEFAGAQSLGDKKISVAAVRQQEIEISFDAIDSLQSEQIEIPLFDGTAFPAVQRAAEGFKQHNADSFSWSGKIYSGEFEGDVILSVYKGAMSGLIYSPKSVYSIIPQSNGKHILVQIDQNLFPSNENDTRVAAFGKSDHKTNQTIESPVNYLSNYTGENFSPSLADNGSQIDVLIVYTDDVRTFLGGTQQAEAFAQQAIAVTNTAYANSGITPRLRLVGAMELNYTETQNTELDLNNINANATVAAARNTLKADVVGFFTETASNGLCGIARLMALGQNTAAFESQAFSVSKRECAVDSLTFPHELGHNQGANHHPAAGLPQNQAVFPYAFGHFDTTANFRTVVAAVSSCPTCPRIPYFSNPNINYNGAPTGIADQRDNVRTINNNALLFAQFRDSGACLVTLNPTNHNNVPIAGGSGSITVTSGCQWNAVSDSGWITVTSGSSGNGNGTVNYTVAANPGANRTGNITIGNQSFTINQLPEHPCAATTQISFGQTINGALAAGDCVVGSKYRDRYSFHGIAGQQIVVSQNSTFDTYLYLLNSSGQVIAENDDIVSGNTNSRIPASGTFSLPATGSYIIAASSYSNSITGAYTVSLTTPNAVHNVTGTVTYGTTPIGQTPKLVANVLFKTTGTSSLTALTNVSGIYSLENLTTNGNYTVTPEKTGNVNGITSFDATLVLRHVAAGGTGPNALSTIQQLAANADGAGGVDSFDATLILRYVAAGRANGNTAQVGNWKFNPANVQYSGVNGSFPNQNYSAVIVGEVDGDWTP